MLHTRSFVRHDGRRGRRKWIALLAAAGVLLLAVMLRPEQGPVSPPPVPGEWVFLSDLTWAQARTDWLAVAQSGLPTRDAAFAGGPLQIKGAVYEKGLGTYPLAEIIYRLDGQYQLFASLVGVDDSALREGSVQFLVFADDVLAYDSGAVRRGDSARQVEVSLAGRRELRLVTVGQEEGGLAPFADWAEARLWRPAKPLDETAIAAAQAAVAAYAQGLADSRLVDAEAMDVAARQEIDAVEAALGERSPTGSGVVGAFDQAAHKLVLANERLAVTYGLGGPEHGRLTVVDLAQARLVMDGVTGRFRLGASGPAFVLASHTAPSAPDSYRFVAVEDPVFGRGQRLEARLAVLGGDEEVEVLLTLFANQPYFLYQLAVNRPRGERTATFNLLDVDGQGRFLVGEQAEYVTDFGRLRRMAVRDDGLTRREYVGGGKPLLLWSNRDGRGVIIAALDEARANGRVTLRLDPGRVAGSLGFVTGHATRINQPERLLSPRLLLSVVEGDQPLAAFGDFRRLMAQLYPAAPLPAWVKYQWLSWYTYYMDIDEVVLKQQIDYIAENLADLGPWHILVDAGWYVAEGREGADWRKVDRLKFPSGLRALVDYAHGRGVKVVLYLSVPYLDSRQRAGDWLGLRAIIEQHPDWLTLLGEDETHQSYAFDFTRPAVRTYWQAVLQDFFVRYDVDGIKIDGLGNAEGAILSPRRVDAFGLVGRMTAQTMDIYRFMYETATALKGDVYVESGWQDPLLANPYSHTFRYGDEQPAFSNPYPFPGLVEHVDYAILQKEMLGQRANMGALRDEPYDSPLKRWWLGAGLALGTQVVLSFNLAEMAPETLSAYRELLVHYNAFQGQTFVGKGLQPDVFATQTGEITYLGLLNRQSQGRELAVQLADYGLAADGEYLAYDAFTGAAYRARGALRVPVEPQSFRLLLLRRQPGIIWTNSSFTTTVAADGMTIVVGGPPAVPGHLAALSPAPQAVYLDGRLLTAATEPDEDHYAHDAAAGLLRLRYSHSGRREISVGFSAE